MWDNVLVIMDTRLYRMCGEVYTYEQLREASRLGLDDLNELQGSNFSFDDYLIESVQAGTIEALSGGDSA